MTFEETLDARLDARLTPLLAAIERLTGEVAQLRKALPPQLVSPDEASKLLGLSLSTIRRRIRDGSLPTRKLGRAVRIDIAALRPLSDGEVAAEAWKLRHEGSRSVTHNQ